MCARFRHLTSAWFTPYEGPCVWALLPFLLECVSPLLKLRPPVCLQLLLCMYFVRAPVIFFVFL